MRKATAGPSAAFPLVTSLRMTDGGSLAGSATAGPSAAIPLVASLRMTDGGSLAGSATAGPSASFPLVTSLRMTDGGSLAGSATAGPSASFPLVTSLRMTSLFEFAEWSNFGTLLPNCCGGRPLVRFSRLCGLGCSRRAGLPRSRRMLWRRRRLGRRVRSRKEARQ